MKVLVVDNLTETFNGPIVRSGLQKSSKLDARAFHKMGYDTTFVYCGNIEDHYTYNKVCVNDIGAKEDCIKNNKHMRASGIYVKSYLKNISNIINDYDYIIAHCHSVGMLDGINSMVKNKNIIFVFHDVIDLTWAYGFSKGVINLRKNCKNNIYLATNSQYSIDRLNYIFKRAKDKTDLLSGDDAFDGYVKHFVWTDIVPTQEEIIIKEKKSAIIGRFEPGKFHHKLYDYKNINNQIVHYGIKDPRRDENLKYYNKLIAKANAYKENLSDDELWQAIKTSQSVILPCWHEGFGYTAFEAGIFGAIPVIFTKEIEKGMGYRHATTEYLTRANVKYFSGNFSDNENVYEAINKSLDVTIQDRLNNSKNLLEYFTVENYVQERINILNKNHNRDITTLESFFS